MKKSVKLLLVVSLFFISQKTNATVGCLVGNTLYTSTNGAGSGITYFDTSPATNASGYCLRTGTITTTPCQLRTWYWIFWSYGSSGQMGDYGPPNPPEYCPIDDYLALIAVPVAFAGFYFIRKRYTAANFA